MLVKPLHGFIDKRSVLQVIIFYWNEKEHILLTVLINFLDIKSTASSIPFRIKKMIWGYDSGR